MNEAYSVLIPAVSIFFVTGILIMIFMSKRTKKATRYYVMGGMFLLSSVLMVIGMAVGSDGWVVFGLFAPLGAMMVHSAVITLIRFGECSVPVIAKCVGYNRTGKGMYYVPEFTYSLKGKRFFSQSFLSYSPPKFKSLFEVGGNYTVYIDPDDPDTCVDKRYYSPNSIFAGIMGVIFILIGFVLLFAL